MSISWRRDTNTTSVTDRSSGHRRFSSLQGARVVPKRRTCPELASESSSCSNYTGEEDCAAIVSDKRFSKQTSGTPMKKLLALEMFKENESKRRSPSVIARLMGFDGLPTQQKQHRSSSGTSQHKTQKSSPSSSSRRSSRKSSKDEQEFKDVFEVLDASKMDNSSCSSRGTANSKPTVTEVALVREKFMDASKMDNSSCSSRGTANSKATVTEVALVREKFMDAKRLSADERFQDSKELDDALEVLEANKDILLQFLPKPDFLLRKHLHDLQSTTPHPRNIRMHKKEEETFQINHDKYPEKHQGVRYRSYGTCPSPPKPSRYGLQEENDHALLPTRIVLLKPNPKKSFNPSSRTLSPPRSSHHISSDIRKPGEILHLKNKDAEILNKKSVEEEVGLSGCTSKESRKIAKEITRQMRNNFRRRPTKMSNCTLRGYAGDESSCDSSSNESVDESDILFPRSKDIHDWNKQLRKSSRLTESFVSQEEKRRLSQRWKITNGPQDLDSIYRSNTLGEMLAIPDSEGRPANFTAEEGYTSRSSSNTIVGTAKEPLGISSRDGWKDGCLSHLSRSRSVPSSSVGFGSPKRSYHEILCRDKFVIPQEGIKRERNKLANRNFNQREDSLSRNLRVRGKEAQTATCSAVEKTIDPESCFIYEVDEQDLVSEPSACGLHTSSVHEYTVGANFQSSPLLSADCSVESYAPSPMHDDVCNGNDIRSNQGQLNKGAPDHPASELESHGKPKEGDQPSPISILEAPFTDDASSGSEGFESLSADLHGLRMQLKMLKLESEAYEEGPMFVSSDEDAGKEGSVVFQKKGMMLREDSRWESSYILDVLTVSGINDTDPDTFMATWHSPDCPVNPLLFEELEKKYCDHQIHECRSNRKLLFDLINSKLLEIHQEYADQHQWVKSSNRAPTRWGKLDLEDKLLMQLLPGKHTTRMNIDACETALARESKWLQLQEDIDLIGREVERWLIDELVTEVVAV